VDRWVNDKDWVRGSVGSACTPGFSKCIKFTARLRLSPSSRWLIGGCCGSSVDGDLVAAAVG
jgi:hypothetical protein